MKIPNQITAFDVPQQKKGVYRIYHDESGTDTHHSRFQLHGVILVPESKWKWALEKLTRARTGYDGCVHFSDLRDKSSSLKSKVAVAWLDLYFKELSSDIHYKCMIADTGSPAFKSGDYPEPHYLYNRTAATAVWGSVTWSLHKYDIVDISIYSENMSRTKSDNFIDYLPKEVVNRSERNTGKKHPKIILTKPTVTLVDGDPKTVSPELRSECEFIQLVDILTGAVALAINAQASQKIKISLGKLAASWIKDSRLPPWLQSKDLHRKFSISCFPDAQGKFYDVPLAIEQKEMDKLPGF